MIDLIGFFQKVRKFLAFFKKKSAKGVDNPIWVCHSLASSLNVLQKNDSALFKN
jgi:hypothetical protein